ncbi:MAG: hypothetical protein ACW9XH_00350 [Candidatus Nitrosopumilus sp. bin_32a]
MKIDEIVKQLESKRKDCIAFQKKYTTRNMQDLLKYYEGGEWALTYCLKLIEEVKNGD